MKVRWIAIIGVLAIVAAVAAPTANAGEVKGKAAQLQLQTQAQNMFSWARHLATWATGFASGKGDGVCNQECCQTGDCTCDCDGEPDRDRTQDRLGTQQHDRDQDRLNQPEDGNGDPSSNRNRYQYKTDVCNNPL